MIPYLELIDHILSNGKVRSDRTGTGTLGISLGHSQRYDLREGFPLLQARRVHFKGILTELLWFIKGDTSIKYLHDHDVTIWDEWVKEDGTIGPGYGKQWRSWKGVTDQNEIVEIDQLTSLIKSLRDDPYGRRHLVNAWNVAQLKDMALPPCHLLFQCYVDEDHLDLLFYMRSSDVYLGLPYNIASYATLLSIIAVLTEKVPRYLTVVLGDTHLYLNHVEQATALIARQPIETKPVLLVNPNLSLETLSIGDFILKQYHPHPKLNAPVSV